jgi:hypothetical protein
MYADAVAKMTESIFPIFFVRQDGECPVMGVSGTGFFVDDGGLFVTAEHFMSPPPDGTTSYTTTATSPIRCVSRRSKLSASRGTPHETSTLDE